MALLVKICGLKTIEALDAALDAGADMVGFVFFPPSPRNLGLEAAKVLGERVKGRAKKVALSVDATDAELAAAIEALKPDMLQLHGKEAPERVASVRSRFRLPVMKALADRDARRPLAGLHLCQGRRLAVVRCPRAARGDAARRARQAVRLDGARTAQSRCAVHALGRARCRQCRRGAAHRTSHGGRCVVRCRARAGREGPGQNPRVRSSQRAMPTTRSPTKR